MTNDEMPLFSFDDIKEKAFVEERISDNQVAILRGAFREAHMKDPEERAELVRSCVIRPVSSLKDLRPQDVRPILRRIKERSDFKGPAVGSAWDTREGDTWIDKM